MTLDDVFEELLDVVSSVGAQVDVPIESEEYFERILASFVGDQSEFIEHVRKNISDWFEFLNGPPNWIHEAEWQYSNGKPMVFVDSITVPAEKSGLHDEAVFFVFWNRDTGETKTVVQVG